MAASGMPSRVAHMRMSLDRSEPDEAVFHHEVELQGVSLPINAPNCSKWRVPPVRRTLMRTIRFEDGTTGQAAET